MTTDRQPRPDLPGKPPPPLDFPSGTRVAMALLTWTAPLHLGLSAASGWFVNEAGWTASAGAFFTVLYLLPPLAARIIRLSLGIREGLHPVGSRGFLSWWAVFQWQAVFNRFPSCEEALRLIPGLYSLWLRLWGAKVGSMVHWTPGLIVQDRPWLDIGGHVALGAGVRLYPHLIDRAPGGQTALLLATIRLGDGCSIGACSLLNAGNEVAPGEGLRAFTVSPPLSIWKDGRRHKSPHHPHTPENSSSSGSKASTSSGDSASQISHQES